MSHFNQSMPFHHIGFSIFPIRTHGKMHEEFPIGNPICFFILSLFTLVVFQNLEKVFWKDIFLEPRWSHFGHYLDLQCKSYWILNTFLKENLIKSKLIFLGKLGYVLDIVWWVHNWANDIGHTSEHNML